MNAPQAKRPPKVTICVPVYNGEKYLKAALDSILKQTYKNFELYILDNRSTDKTPEIARSYKDRRIKYVRNHKNLGSLGNWNKCTRTGRGEYVAIYHADDVYEPTILAKEVAVLEKHRDVCCVFANSTAIDRNGRVIGKGQQPPHLVDRPITFKDVYFYMLETFRSPYTAPTCMARRSAYRKVTPYNPAVNQAGDVDMYLRLTAVGGAYLISKRLLRYRHSDGQASIRYSTTYTKPNQLFRVLDTKKRFLKDEIPSHLQITYESYRDWDHTVCAINLLAKSSENRSVQTQARRHLCRSLTWRRFKRFYREPLLISITTAMIVATYVGWGDRLAKLINKTRWRRHLT